MSLRDPSLPRRWAGRLVLSAVLSLPLAACGSGSAFQPLHGPTASGAQLDERLAQLDFATIPGRVGQQIRNELVFQSTGVAGAKAPTHRVEIVTTETVLSTLVKADGNSLGQIYQLEAHFRILDLKDKKIVFQGRSLGRAGFERFESIYSNVRAREDAENRAARSVATDLKTRLAAFVSGTAQ
jgi:LPS-assembly lipoprotein